MHQLCPPELRSWRRPRKQGAMWRHFIEREDHPRTDAVRSDPPSVRREWNAYWCGHPVDRRTWSPGWQLNNCAKHLCWLTSNSSGGVQFGFNNPVNFNGGLGGLKQAYFQTATFSNGQYTVVSGAWAPIGIPWGSTTGSSWLLRSALNGSQQALDLGNYLTRLASGLRSVTCSALFGGG
jgi:hypothetical protein